MYPSCFCALLNIRVVAVATSGNKTVWILRCGISWSVTLKSDTSYCTGKVWSSMYSFSLMFTLIKLLFPSRSVHMTIQWAGHTNRNSAAKITQYGNTIVDSKFCRTKENTKKLLPSLLYVVQIKIIWYRWLILGLFTDDFQLHRLCSTDLQL